MRLGQLTASLLVKDKEFDQSVLRDFEGALPPNYFPTWLRERFPTAIEALEKTKLTNKPYFWRLAWRLIDDALKAAAWNDALAAGKKDPWEAGRVMDADFLEESNNQAAAAKSLAAFFGKFPQQAGRTLHNAGLNVGGGKWPSGSSLAVLLRGFAKQLKDYPDAKSGLHLHRYMIGPVFQGNAIDEQTARANFSEFGLLYSCVYWSRGYTSGSVKNFDFDAVMTDPYEKFSDKGRPLFPVSCGFLSDALECYQEPKSASTRLAQFMKRNPHSRYIGWPNPPDEHWDIPNPNTWKR